MWSQTDNTSSVQLCYQWQVLSHIWWHTAYKCIAPALLWPCGSRNTTQRSSLCHCCCTTESSRKLEAAMWPAHPHLAPLWTTEINVTPLGVWNSHHAEESSWQNWLDIISVATFQCGVRYWRWYCTSPSCSYDHSYLTCSSWLLLLLLLPFIRLLTKHNSIHAVGRPRVNNIR